MKSDVRHYRGNEASVTFDTHRCIHAEVCVRGLPRVFDVSRRPWILPDEGDPGRLERVVLGCPTGALRMAPPTDRKVAKGADAAATILPEEPRKKNSASITPDGPYHVRGNLEVEETQGAEIANETRVAFCRCGHSENKPLCDQSHERVGFRCEAAADPGAEPAPPVNNDGAPVRFTPYPNGPLAFRGPLTISGRGGARVTLDRGKLCRCGHSRNRPLCDGSHREAGFSAP
jgi:CDGSH-type Zn-finger protein/uncharacterized Fe-S cluster protein YjdI